MKIGFIGLGLMGEPMALNLLQANVPVLAWNRTTAKLKTLREAGAEVADTVDTLFRKVDVVILMLVDSTAIDAVLGRGTDGFAQRVKGHTIVNMGTTSADYSKALEAEILAVGGRYVEAPVSGSRKPAEEGSLVAMLAGRQEELSEIKPLLAPMCRSVIECGAVPNAILMKLANNLLLISMITGLVEATNFAELNGLDLKKFVDVLLEGPMANDIISVKGPKLLSQDFSAQASIRNVLENNQLIVQAADHSGAYSPLIKTCLKLYEKSKNMGLGELDVVSVSRVLQDKNALPKGDRDVPA